MNISKELLRRLLIVPPIVVGVALLVWMRSNASAPQRQPETEITRVMRVITVPVVDLVPRAEAYGTVRPGQVWRAVAEVKGRVIAVHPELSAGSILPAGETVLQIDPTEYDLAVTRLSADIEQAQAQLAELDVRADNDNASLKIENDALALAENELNRLKGLAAQNAVTPAELDAQQRTTLAQRQKTQTVQNSLRLLPSERKSLEALIAVKQAGLAQAQLDLKKTKLVTPFDCRLGEVSIEEGQFLGTGEKLFEAHSTALAEIEAQVALGDAQRLVAPQDKPLTDALPTMETMRSVFKVDAKVSDTSGRDLAHWNGEFLRLRETVNSQTRTIGVVVGVKEPYRQAIPGRRPPLTSGTYCRVVLSGEIRPHQVVVPRSTLRNSSVFVLDGQRRLHRQPVEVLFTQGDIAVINSGLSGGETLIVSDPVPAVEGLLVEPRWDETAQKLLVEESTGQSQSAS